MTELNVSCIVMSSSRNHLRNLTATYVMRVLGSRFARKEVRQRVILQAVKLSLAAPSIPSLPSVVVVYTCRSPVYYNIFDINILIIRIITSC